MRELERINRILEKLKEQWEKDPDQRFFQLIYNLQRIYSKSHNGLGQVNENQDGINKIGFDFFNLEDNKFEQYLEEILKYQNMIEYIKEKQY